jgi:predicted rRNA methylase YqxC with S4 and FtsJ domains
MVCSRIDASLTEAGCAVLGWTESPIKGSDGNQEFLVWARRDRVAPCVAS